MNAPMTHPDAHATNGGASAPLATPPVKTLHRQPAAFSESGKGHRYGRA